jgi:hypothetical protein
MVKIWQTGLLKLNFETRPKLFLGGETHNAAHLKGWTMKIKPSKGGLDFFGPFTFSGFSQIFPQAMDEVDKFFWPISKSLGP